MKMTNVLTGVVLVLAILNSNAFGRETSSDLPMKCQTICKISVESKFAGCRADVASRKLIYVSRESENDSGAAARRAQKECNDALILWKDSNFLRLEVFLSSGYRFQCPGGGGRWKPVDFTVEQTYRDCRYIR